MSFRVTAQCTLSYQTYASRLNVIKNKRIKMTGNIEGSSAAASKEGGAKAAGGQTTARRKAGITDTGTVVDFRRSLPPAVPMLGPLLSAAFHSLEEHCNLSELMHGSVARGSDAERSAGARLLAPRLGPIRDLNRVTPTNGTQSALLILIKHLVSEGRVLFAEELTYGALKAIAKLAGVTLRGLPIDQDGILPGPFEAVCKSGIAGALYCNPTIQNPTTAIMSEARRRDLARIAQRFGVPIIEDDALGRLHPGATQPIARLAPDICWYLMTTSKCLAHGLRLAYLVSPSKKARDSALRLVENLSFWNATPLSTGIMTQWTNTDAANVISSAIHDENAAREAYARSRLGKLGLVSKPASMHAWLPLPEGWPALQFVEHAETLGVLVRPAQLFASDDAPVNVPNAVRLSLSTPGSREAAEEGIDRICALLDEKVGPTGRPGKVSQQIDRA